MAELLDFIPLFQETLNTIRARYDADANAGLAPDDEAFLDTTVGGFYFDLTQPSALECERLWDVVATVLPASMHPAFAWGDYLDEWALTVGIERKAAVKATGEILIFGPVGTAIASGTRIGIIQTDPDADPVEFFTTVTSTTLSIYPGVTGFNISTHQTDSGILTPATYYYRVSALTPAGETIASLEAVTSVSAQFLAAPTGLGSTAFTTGGSLASGTYYYKVTALNANGQTIASTEHSRAVTGPNGRVDLTWGAVPGAASYRIYRGTSANGQNTYYTSATNSFSDTGAAGTAGTPPNTNTAQVGRIILDWADYAGATGYRIYRSTAPNEERFLAQIGPTSDYSDTGAVAPSGAPYPTNTMPVEAVEPGASGNVPPEAITQLLTPIAGVSVTNPAPTSGGADVESDELLRERVLLEFSSRPGAGTIADYERWARSFPPVGYATVEALWSGAGTVRLIVTDQDNNPVSASVVSGLQNYLDPVPGQGRGLAPIGAVVTVITPTTVAVTVAATLVLLTGYSLDGASATIAVRGDIERAVMDYIDMLKPGEDVVLHNVRAQIFKVPGVYDVPSLSLNGTAANLAIGPTQIALTQTPISLS